MPEAGTAGRDPFFVSARERERDSGHSLGLGPESLGGRAVGHGKLLAAKLDEIGAQALALR